MLDMGFIEDVEDIAAELKEGHQTVLFSATMNQKVRKLSERLLTDPVKVEIKQDTMVAKTIDHKLMNVTRRNKSQLLVQILQGENVEKVLVFSRTKRGADELSDMLYNEGIRSDAIHGDKKQRVREKILMNFKRGRTAVLVATDVAARGIDVDGISHVVNYELPIEPENYVHRVGRTGRAGASGIAISFCDPSDIRLLRNIEELIKMKITVDEEHEFHIPLANGAHSMKRGGGDFGRGGRSGGGRERGAFGRNRERGAFGRDDNGARGARNDRSDRGGRSARGVRNDRSDRGGQSDRGGYSKDFSYTDDSSPAERGARENKWSNKDSAPRSDRSSRPARFENNDRNDRGGRSDRDSRPDRGGRFESDSRSDRGDRSDQNDRSSRFSNNDRNDRDSRPAHRSERSDRNDRVGYSNRDDRRPSSRGQRAPKNTERYDHWGENKNRGGENKNSGGENKSRANKFDNDPVLKKLIGKPPVMKAKKPEREDFSKSAAPKKKNFSNRRESENDSGNSRGGNKTLSARSGKAASSRPAGGEFTDGRGTRSPGKKNMSKGGKAFSKNAKSGSKGGKPARGKPVRGNNKPSGGNKAFSPKRNKRAA
jgi:ATP-dependent RNA helicase RhlE